MSTPGRPNSFFGFFGRCTSKNQTQGHMCSSQKRQTAPKCGFHQILQPTVYGFLTILQPIQKSPDSFSRTTTNSLFKVNVTDFIKVNVTDVQCKQISNHTKSKLHLDG